MYSPGEPRNQAGVISVILGGLALATCWLLIGVPLGIAALLSGDIARRRVSRGEATNPRAAIAGMVLGAVAIVAGLVAIGYYSWLDSQDPGRLQRCLDNPATTNC
jgi:ABC-type phosphate transport system permease subunit